MPKTRTDRIHRRRHLSRLSRRDRRTAPRPAGLSRKTQESHRDQGRRPRKRMRTDDLLTAWIVVQQKSLKDDPHVPRLVKWFLRWVYFRYGWAATGHDGKSYTKLEFVGIYDSAPAARYAAMVPGGSYRELPLNCSLPEETCQFGSYDHPMSDASSQYRHRKMPFITISRAQFNAMDRQVEQTANCAEGRCVKA